MDNPQSVDRIVNPRSVISTVLIEIAKNAAMSVPVVRRIRAALGRTMIAEETQALDRYVFRLFELVCQYCGNVAGKSILEIGPGDNLATGLAFLAAGARSYTAIDRFPGAYRSAAARGIYRQLASAWPYGTWPAHLDPETFPDGANVTTAAMAVENVSHVFKFDIVCSYHVGEHVSNIDSFAKLTAYAVNPTGTAVHQIDFGGHQWNRFGDPFLFLKFPSWIWSMMGSERGEPNRIRFDEYRAAFARAGLDVQVPARRLCTHDPRDPWVAPRANDSFRTTDATFVLRHTPGK